MLDHDALQQTLRDSVAVRLLNSPHTPLIASFLYEQFKVQHNLTIHHSLLLERLEDYLDFLRQAEPEMYRATAVSYLDNWCNKSGYLRKYHLVGSDDPVYELTAEAERALRWLEELQSREFIGTESRFLYIFDLMQDMVQKSNSNVPDRLAYLAQQKADIEAEMALIEATGEVETYSDTQLKEKFFELNDTARRLLADFRAVEDNFRAIAREVQQRQLQANVRKGEIVRHVLEADEALKESDQGRSFYAFWQFLMSQSKQDELRDLLAAVLQITAVSQTSEQRVLRHLKRSLIDAGSKIVESNRRLAEQLRKLLDEQNLQEARRVRELAAEIKQIAAQLAAADEADSWTRPSRQTFVTITGSPEVNLPLERPLWEPRPQVDFSEVVIEEALPEVDPELLSTIYTQFFVDEALLYERIEALLEERGAVTLGEVVARYPLEKGLAEVLAYVAIATRSFAEGIDLGQVVALGLNGREGEHGRVLHIPQIIFSSAER